MQTAFGFPQPLVERYRPQTIDAFVGIPQAKEAARAILDAPMPNSAFLFAGESGLGKTALALAIAKTLNAQLHHIPARQASREALDAVWESVQYAPWGNGWGHIVLVDEADLARIDIQQGFLSLLDSTASLANALFGDWRPCAPRVVWIFTTNADSATIWTDSRFEQRFLSRVRIVPFSNYGIQRELTDYLRVIWDAEIGTESGDDSPDFRRIAKDLRGNVRACLMALEQEITRRQYEAA